MHCKDTILRTQNNWPYSKLIPNSGKEKKPFNGWKVKIDFEAKTLKGKPFHSEYWFILDKEAEIVVKSFEIPLL